MPSCILILGYNGTGKTTITRQLIAHEAEKGGRSLIIIPDDIEYEDVPYIDQPKQVQGLQGVAKTIFFEKETLEMIMDNYNNGQLVFEDFRSYLGSITKSETHYLLIRRRQLSIDIIACAHGFTEIPPKFFTFASDIILFQTKDNIYSRKNQLRNFDEMVEAQQRINKIAETNPHYYEILNNR